MEWMYSIYFFIFGSLFGSFYNVVGLRIPKNESIVKPPSHCPTCKRQLKWYELIPIFSYVMQRGKCRHCKMKISPVYLLTEFVTGVLFVIAYLHFGFTMELGIAILFISLLVIINVSDIAYMLIPNKILLFFLPFLVIGRILSPLTPWWDALLGAIVGFGILYLIAILSKGGMGGGDIKLFFLIGLVLGTVNTLITLFLASFIGVIIGLIVLLLTKKGRKTPVPFGPSIAIAALIVYFYGEQLVTGYKNLF